MSRGLHHPAFSPAGRIPPLPRQLRPRLAADPEDAGAVHKRGALGTPPAPCAQPEPQETRPHESGAAGAPGRQDGDRQRRGRAEHQYPPENADGPGAVGGAGQSGGHQALFCQSLLRGRVGCHTDGVRRV